MKETQDFCEVGGWLLLEYWRRKQPQERKSPEYHSGRRNKGSRHNKGWLEAKVEEEGDGIRGLSCGGEVGGNLIPFITELSYARG